MLSQGGCFIKFVQILLVNLNVTTLGKRNFCNRYDVIIINSFLYRGRHGRNRMVVGFTTTMQSVPITTDVVSSNLDQGEVHNMT